VKRLSVWGKGEKIARRQTFGTAIPPSCLVIADHLSARLLSVTWIHWNVINFTCKRGVGRQHTYSYLVPKCWFFQWVFSLAGRLRSGGFSFNWENVTFAAFFILRCGDTHMDFMQLFFLVGVICPLMQEHSLWLKKLISQPPDDAMFKFRRPIYKRLFKSNRVLRTDQKSNVNQPC